MSANNTSISPDTPDASNTSDVCRWCTKGPVSTPTESVTLYPSNHSNFHHSCFYNQIIHDFDPLNFRRPTCNRTVAEVWSVSRKFSFPGGFLPMNNWQPMPCRDYSDVWLETWLDRDRVKMGVMIREMRGCRLTYLGWQPELKRVEWWFVEEGERIKGSRRI